MFFSREDLKFKKDFIIKFFNFFLKEKYYRPVWKAKLKEYWISKLHLYFYINLISLFFYATGIYGLLVFLILTIPAVLLKHRWEIEALFLIIYIYMLLHIYGSLQQLWQKTAFLIIAVFFLRDFFYYVFENLFWILSKIFCLIPIISRNWDNRFLNFFFFPSRSYNYSWSIGIFFFRKFLGYVHIYLAFTTFS